MVARKQFCCVPGVPSGGTELVTGQIPKDKLASANTPQWRLRTNLAGVAPSLTSTIPSGSDCALRFSCHILRDARMVQL
jgi:hypothetical protein